VSHNQVRKTPTGQWETVGKDYFSVVAPEDARHLTENTRVNVKGRMKTKLFDKRDGSKGVSLEVRADEVTVLAQGTQREDKQGAAAITAVWDTVPIAESAPF
jgi:single-stranded DNA-binding protein